MILGQYQKEGEQGSPSFLVLPFPSPLIALSEFSRRYWLWLGALALTAAVLVTYAGAFGMGFVTDDFIEVGLRHFNAVDTLARDDFGAWLQGTVRFAFVDAATGWQVIRPVREVLYSLDYMIWGLNPFGYHLTNILLHLGTTFLVALIAWRLERNALAALIAGLLFAIHPAHSAPIAEVSSRGHVLAALFICLTVLFYMLPRRRWTAVAAWSGYALALGSKETAIMTPALLLLYEVVVHRQALLCDWRGLFWRQLPFWLTALAYVGLRLVLFGRLDTSSNAPGQYAFSYQLAGYTLFTIRPFLVDVNDTQTFVFVLALAVLLVLYRKRAGVVMGLLWVAIALAPTITFQPEERYLYTASVGLALALGSILANPVPRFRFARYAGAAAAALLLLIWGRELVTRVTEYRTASSIGQSIVRQIQQQHPTLPPNARIVLVGVPIGYRRAYIFTLQTHPKYALQMAYGDRTLEAALTQDFPIVLNDLERTFFFEYVDGKLVERADRVAALQQRAGCGEDGGTLIWDFADTEGWEAWNEVADLRAENGALVLRTTGNDPFLGGPVVQIPPRRVQRVQVRMAVTSEASAVQGELYWLTTAMQDFSPEARVEFTVPADGQSHTIELKLEGAERANRGVSLVRFRLDPADVPADVRIESIKVVCS